MQKACTLYLASLLALSTALPFSAHADWYAQISTEYEAAKQNSPLIYKPMLQYSKGKFSTYLEYAYTPINGQTNDEELTWQLEYKWQLSEDSSLKLVHEFSHSLIDHSDRAELTPKLYTAFSDHLKLGFELEIDYYQDGDFEIQEIEIEPTIKWQQSLGKGELNLELEAPTMRLYSNKDGVKDFEFEEILPIVGYSYPLSKTISLEAEAEFPYDLQTDDLDSIITLSIGIEF